MKPILAIVTEAIRRDIHYPLKYFTHFRVVHFYNRIPYGDMTPDDFKSSVQAVQFDTPAKLNDLLKKLMPNIIQGAEPYASRKALRYSLAAQKAARRVGAKFVFPMLENRPPQERFGRPVAYIMKKILRRYATKSDLIFTLNDGARKNLLDIGVTDEKIMPFFWGLWGVDAELFTPEENGKEPDWQLPTALFIGRLVPEKGIRDILQAFAILTNVTPAQLVFVGCGPMQNEIDGYTNSGDERSQITRYDVMAQDKLPPLMRASALVIYPSVTTPKWEEQVGTVNLQAMSCGVPVVSTLSGAIPEYVPEGKAGLLVPENNPQELARAMLTIIQDKELRRRMGEYGRRYILENFDIKDNIAKGEEMLLELLQ